MNLLKKSQKPCLQKKKRKKKKRNDPDYLEFFKFFLVFILISWGFKEGIEFSTKKGYEAIGLSLLAVSSLLLQVFLTKSLKGKK